MKLFGKKKLSVDEILAGIEALSDEEKRRLEWTLGGGDEPGEESPEEPPQAEEQPEAPAEEAPVEETPAEPTEEVSAE